jgi:hypothetical protein
MRQVLILLKYASSVFSLGASGGTVRPRKRTFKYGGLFTSLIMMAALGIPMYFLSGWIYGNLRIPLAGIGLPYPGYLADMYLALGLLSSAFLFFLSYSPSVAFNLFGSEDFHLLLSFPITRTQIFAFKAIDSIAFGSVGIALVIPLILAYAQQMGYSLWLALLAAVLLLLFLGSISLLIAALLSRLVSGNALRRAAFLFYLLSILGFVAIMQIVPRSAENLAAIFEGLRNLFHVIYSPFLFTRWVLDIVSGQWLGLVILLACTVVLGWVTARISNRLAFQVGSSSKSRKARFAQKTARWPLFARDLHLLVREPMNIYGFVYPVALGLIMLFVNPKDVGGIVAPAVTVFMAVFFSAMTTATLLREERKAWPTPLLYPISLRQMLAPKLWLPAAFFIVAYGLILLLVLLVSNGNPWLLLTLPMTLAISLACSAIGANFYLRRPITTSKNFFGFVPVMVLELGALLLTFLTIVFFILFLLYRSAPFVLLPGWLQWAISWVWPYIWGLLIPFGVTALLYVFFLRRQRVLMRVLRDWE